MTARLGSFSEELERRSERHFVGVFEREGTYDVSVAKPGLAPWMVRGVRVVVDPTPCHVVTTELRAELRPAPKGDEDEGI